MYIVINCKDCDQGNEVTTFIQNIMKSLDLFRVDFCELPSSEIYLKFRTPIHPYTVKMELIYAMKKSVTDKLSRKYFRMNSIIADIMTLPIKTIKITDRERIRLCSRACVFWQSGDRIDLKIIMEEGDYIPTADIPTEKFSLRFLIYDVNGFIARGKNSMVSSRSYIYPLMWFNKFDHYGYDHILNQDNLPKITQYVSDINREKIIGSVSSTITVNANNNNDIAFILSLSIIETLQNLSAIYHESIDLYEIMNRISQYCWPHLPMRTQVPIYFTIDTGCRTSISIL